MPELRLEGLKEEVIQRVRSFFEEIIREGGDRVHSIHVTGSSLTADFDESASDTNSVIVMNEIDLDFLEALAPKGKKYVRKKIASPLIITPRYIKTSLDVFPIEFLNMKLLHHTVFGADVLAGIEVSQQDLRAQCERELKLKLISLRQGYLSTMGDRKALTEGLMGSIKSYVPLFRGILRLCCIDPPPLLKMEVVDALTSATGLDCGVFKQVLVQSKGKAKLSKEQLDEMFENYYSLTDKLVGYINDIKV